MNPITEVKTSHIIEGMRQREKELGFNGGETKVYHKPVPNALQKLLDKTKHAKKQAEEVGEVIEETINKVVTNVCKMYRLNQQKLNSLQKWIIKYNDGKVKFVFVSNMIELKGLV